MQTTLIVHGSKMSALKKAHNFVKLAERAGISCKILQTCCQGHARELVEQLSDEVDVLIAVGGDGTVNECVNGWVGGARTTRFAVLPSGSGNDFVKSVNMDVAPQKLITALRYGASVPCDIGVLNHSGRKEYFVNIADAGLGPSVVGQVQKCPNWMAANFKFKWSILRTFVGYRKSELYVKGAGFAWKGNPMMIAVANGKYFASGMGIAPEAEVSSGCFEVIVVGNISLVSYLTLLPKIMRCEKIYHPKIHYFKSDYLEINGDSSMEKDGELGLPLPVKISVLKGELSLVKIS